MPRSETKKMNDKKLKDHIWSNIDDGLNNEDGDIQETCAELFDRYMGGKDWDNSDRPDLSTYQTREIMEAIEWCMPPVTRALLGGHRVVEFEASKEEDEASAEQESDVVNYRVLRANKGDGWVEMQNFIKNALMFPNAYIKVFVEENEETTVEHGDGFTEDAVMALARKQGVEITAQRQYVESTAMGELMFFELEWTRTKKTNVIRIMTIPTDEIIIDSSLATLSLDEAKFIAHRTTKSMSELVEMGYDKAEIEKATTSPERDTEYGTLRDSRFFYTDERRKVDGSGNENNEDKANRMYKVYECHLLFDYDGDDKAERRKVVVVGNEIFENEPMDYNPFVSMGAISIPNKHVQMALSQIVYDIQRLNTTLHQQLLNNIYKTNVSKHIISEHSLTQDGGTLEALQDTGSPYAVVYGSATDAVVPLMHQTMVGDILPVIQHAQQQASVRTGIAPENTVDPNVLQQANTGAFLGAMQKQSERIELIIRLMAETGFKNIFRKVHYLCRTYPNIEETIKLRGTWVPVDTAAWGERENMRANVGVGFMNKEEKLSLLSNIYTLQQELLPTGIADLSGVYASVRRIVEYSDVGVADSFFVSPESPEFQPPEPQPPAEEVLKLAQAKKIEADIPLEQQKAEFETQMNTEKLLLDKEKVINDINKEKGELELQVKELELKALAAAIDADKTAADAAHTDAATESQRAEREVQIVTADKVVAETEKIEAETVKTLEEAKHVKEGGDDGPKEPTG